MPGLLDLLDPAQAGNAGLAAGLLTRGGPSYQPTSFGPALGAGLLASQQMQLDAQIARNRTSLANAQTEQLLLQNQGIRRELNTPPGVEYKALGNTLVGIPPQGQPYAAFTAPDSTKGPFGTIDPSKYTPESIRRFLVTGNYADLRAVPKEPLVKIINQPDKWITATDAEKIVDDQGRHPPPGTTYGDLAKPNSPYRISSTQEQQIQLSAKGAKATLTRLDELVGKIFTEEGSGVWNRIKQGGTFNWSRIRQDDPNLIAFDAFSQGTLAPLIRAIGEKGNLANQDIERAIQLIPSTGNMTTLPDTKDVAEAKMAQLKQWFARATAAAGQSESPSQVSRDKVESAGWPYEPDKYEYRIGPNGRVQRRPKGG